MGSERDLHICGAAIAPGESRRLSLELGESYLGSPVSAPIQVIRAEKPGPTLAITGCVHGDELNGMGIVRELLFDQPPELVSGSLVCVPVVNVFALEHHMRYMPDRRDLNRSFPGREHGSLTSRFAFKFFNEIIRPCNYLIDFHSAAIRRTNFPNVRANLRIPAVRELALAFGSELVINGKGPSNSLRREATRAGVPCMILEAGEIWKVQPGVVDVGVRGVMNVLKTLKMVEGAPVRPQFQTIIQRTTWLRAERGGTLGFHVAPGDTVEKGDELATNYNIFGDERRQILAPSNGIILGMSTMPVVKPGDPVFHLALLSKAKVRDIRSRLAAGSPRTPFRRLKRDLSTSVHEVESQ